jgi:hypothetical protein
LNAPRNCVQKNGRKRRSRKRPNWLCCDMRPPLSGLQPDRAGARRP